MFFKTKIFKILDEEDRAEYPLNGTISSFIMILIILSIVAVILESDKTIYHSYGKYFYWFEIFAVLIFTIEYISRIWIADMVYPDLSKFGARVKFLFTPLAIIDLLAILPFYVDLLHIILVSFGITLIDLRFVRVLRLMRLLRIFKLNRYSNSMKMIGDVLKEEKEKLLITIFMTFILLVFASALIYTVEHEAQPDKFPNIYSSMWWSIATLTTVGYGDVFPVTAFGKILAGIIALLGIGLVALPTGILSSSFVERLQEERLLKARRRSQKKIQEENNSKKTEHYPYKYCPHCGEKII